MDLTLIVGVISAMDILTTTDTCDYLWIRFLFFKFYLVQDLMIFNCEMLGGFLFGWLLCMSSGSIVIGGGFIHV